MEPHEVNNSKVFWDKHILLKKIWRLVLAWTWQLVTKRIISA
jgi:hypothetical protein